MNRHQQALAALYGLFSRIHEHRDEMPVFSSLDGDKKTTPCSIPEKNIFHRSIDKKIFLADDAIVLKVVFNRKLG